MYVYCISMYVHGIVFLLVNVHVYVQYVHIRTYSCMRTYIRTYMYVYMYVLRSMCEGQ